MCSQYYSLMRPLVEEVRKQGRPQKKWLDYISDWTKMDIKDLVNCVHDRDGWRKYVSKSSVLIPPYNFRVTGFKLKVSTPSISYLAFLTLPPFRGRHACVHQQLLRPW